MTPRPTILIIHGAWHIPKSYAKLTTALESSGFDVHIPRLPSVSNARPPAADLKTDIAVVRDYAETLLQDGRTIIALMHSYGGQIGSDALHGLSVEARTAKGLAGGVSHLIYMAAYAVPESVAMMDIVEKFGNMNLVPLAFDIDEEDGSCVSRDPKTLVVSPGPGDDLAEVEDYIGTFERWNAKVMYQHIAHAAWREIPAAYIYTTNDMTVPIHYQKSFVELMEKEGRPVQTFELETGHCPNFTDTDGVVNSIKNVLDA